MHWPLLRFTPQLGEYFKKAGTTHKCELTSGGPR
jgi:hypothetical protein